jgi:type II secretion system protein G
MKRSFPLAQCAVFSRQFSAQGGTASLGSRHSAGFSLIELMVVVTIIAILAGLVLSTVGYVNRKGAASRAQTEVTALAEAIENYKIDFGNYPASNSLYAELTAQSGAVNTNKVYFEPPAGMVSTNTASPQFLDPYGAAYNYSTSPTRNIGFFDLWCVPPDARNASDWIHN